MKAHVPLIQELPFGEIAAEDLVDTASCLDALEYTPVKTKAAKETDWQAVAVRGYADDYRQVLKPGVLKSGLPDDAEPVWTELADMTRLREALDLLPAGSAYDRVRIMKLRAGTQIGKHHDKLDASLGFEDDGDLVRLHFPIRSPDDCRMTVWKGRTKDERHLEVGKWYFVDIRNNHAVDNPSDVDRYHLVADVYSTPLLRTAITAGRVSHDGPGWENAITHYEEVSPMELQANPKNWRTHPPAQLDALEATLNEVGWISSIIVNETTGNMIDGHARVELAIRRGESTVPVGFVSLTEDQEALALATYDPIAAMAGTDVSALGDLVEEVSGKEIDFQSVFADYLPGSMLEGLNGGPDEDENGEDADSDTPASFLLYDREEIVDEAFQYYRLAGFPYPTLEYHEQLQELNKLASRPLDDKLLRSTLAYRVPDSYHTHRLHAHAHNKISPLTAYEDDEKLRIAIDKQIDQDQFVRTGYIPMLSLVRGAQACANFRPAFAMWLYLKWGVPGVPVLDTSTGYGGRLIGWHCSQLGGRYIGIDPNTATHQANERMVSALKIPNVRLINKPAEDVNRREIPDGCAGFAFTSPPYFKKELYADEDTQSWVRYGTHEEWLDGFLRRMLELQWRALKPGSKNVVIIEDVKINNKMFPLVDPTLELAEAIGFTLFDRAEFRIPQKMMPAGGEEEDQRAESVLVFTRP